MSQKNNHNFDEQHVLHVLKHYLPTQGPLKDFVHHNTLHAFQDMKFYDAIFKASSIFGFKTTFSLTEYRDLYNAKRITPEVLDMVLVQHKGRKNLEDWKEKALNKNYKPTNDYQVGKLRKQWKDAYPINLDNTLQPLLFRIVGSYIDQGIAITSFPFEDKGLIIALRNLEKRSLVSFFKTKRARNLLFDEDKCTITNLLEIIVGKNKKQYFEQYIYDQQFGHRGWSGMVSALEDKPESMLYPKNISLKDMIILELLLEIDIISNALGDSWEPLGESIKSEPINIFDNQPLTELQEVLEIWQDAFEWSYYDTVLAGILITSKDKKDTKIKKADFQSIFCIDEREYSLRSHLERLDSKTETFGTPGFFGVEFYFHLAHTKFYDKLCPAPVTPKYLIKEIPKNDHKIHEKEEMFNKHSFKLVRGYFLTYLLGFPSLLKLFINLINPTMSPAIADASSHMDENNELTIVYNGQRDEKENLQIGFTVEEMTDRVEKVLRSIGLTSNFSKVVYAIAHGSSSANNPHHGAHDCGACSGRPGLVNARVFAYMANYGDVRKMLKSRGLIIPEDTQFVGAMHDTASNELKFYDESSLNSSNKKQHIKNKVIFEKALDLDAKERSRRFMSIDTKQSIHKIRKAIKKRSVSYFEPRPELGHGSNAVCVVGRRSLTKKLFLDRRSFLNSYDYTTDKNGELLLDILAPLGNVCGGINLEYYFSRMDNYKLGAGTKLPHNVVGLLGVASSSDGDLRPGLPLQMVEIHDPVRLLMVVEHYPDIVKKVIKSNPSLYEWFENEWIHLVSFDPKTKKLFTFKNGDFKTYDPINKEIPLVDDLPKLFESSKKMETNLLLDATKENLPVHIIK